MEAKELRIGNWVSTSIDGEAIYLVEEIKLHDLFLSNQKSITIVGRIQYHNIYPIPLTEQHLQKFGFYRIAFTDYGHENLKGFVLGLNQTFSGVTDITARDLEIQGIKYVHQLQNFYFALTGKELTLKENESL